MSDLPQARETPSGNEIILISFPEGVSLAAQSEVNKIHYILCRFSLIPD